MDVIDRIKRFQKLSKLSIAQLAEKSGLSRSTVHNIVNHNKLPQMGTLSSLCLAFDITLAQFFDESLSPDIVFILSRYDKWPSEKQDAFIAEVEKMVLDKKENVLE